MKTENTYLDYINKEISNNLYKIREEDFRNNNNPNQEIETPLIDGFLNLYFNQFKYSSIELMDLLKERTIIFEVLFSSYYSISKNRDQWFELFTPAIKNDYEVFYHAFTKFLLTHTDYINKTVPSISEEFSHILYEKNKTLFKKMIQIGKEQNFFKKFVEQDFYTDHIGYQTILIEENLLKTSFSLQKLENALIIKQNNSKNRHISSSKDKTFFSTYIKDIISLKDTHPDFIEELHKKELLIHFVDLFFQTSYIEPLASKQFIQFLFENNIAKKHIFTDKNCQSVLVKYFPELIIPLFESIPEENRVKMFTVYSFNSDLSSSNFYETILRWFDHTNKELAVDKKSVNYSVDVLEYFINGIKSYNSSNPNLVKNLIGRILVTYLTCHQKENFPLSEQFAQDPSLKERYDIVSHFAKYLPSLLNLHDTPHTLLEKDAKQLLLAFSALEQIDPQLKDKLTYKTIQLLQKDVYQIFSPILDNKRLPYHNSSKVMNCAKLLNKTNFFSILDVLNTDSLSPLWSKVHFDTTNKDIGSKIKEDYNLPFYLIEATKGKALDWFIQPENLESFSKITYKNKSFVSYFHTHDWFISTFMNLAPQTEAFKALVLNNKTAMKVISKITAEGKNPDVLRTLNFYKLDDKVKTKEIVKPSQRNKI